MSDYKIVADNDFISFERRCDELVKHGYIPAGFAVLNDGGYIQTFYNPETARGEIISALQAMLDVNNIGQ